MAIDKKLIDQLLTDYKKPEDIIGENGGWPPLRLCFLQRWGAEDSCGAGLPSHPPTEIQDLASIRRIHRSQAGL